MQGLDSELSLSGELGDQTAVFDGVILIHSTLYGDSLGVGYDNPLIKTVSVCDVN